MNEFFTAIQPALASAAVTIVTAVIAALGAYAVKFIAAKRDEAVSRLGLLEYQRKYAAAESAWKAVDEYFRITPTVVKTVETTMEKFRVEIKKVLPGISDTEIDALRMAVAGAVNAGREAISPPVTETAPDMVSAANGNVEGMNASDTTGAD